MEYINKPNEDIVYTKRIGSYGLLLNENRKLAIIKTSTGYFLPGGGLEQDESLEECLKREFREETSIDVHVSDKLSSISYFFYSTTLNIHMESVGHFYKCSYEKKLDEKCEDDHELVWLELEMASKLLFLENQKKAVLDFLQNLK
jgi:8-oxo-dGTP diphosphatase